MDPPQVVRPTPRRTFELHPPSTDSSAPSSPNPEPNPLFLDPKSAPSNTNTTNGASLQRPSTPSRTRSILNLTSSTLFGIYSSPNSGGGTGMETPYRTTSLDSEYASGARHAMRRPSMNWEQSPRRPSSATFQSSSSPYGITISFPLLLRASLLFIFGVAYGLVVMNLHDNAAVVVGTATPQGTARSRDRTSFLAATDWRYLAFWGVAGIGLGSLLPWVDSVWDIEAAESLSEKKRHKRRTKKRGKGKGASTTSKMNGTAADIAIQSSSDEGYSSASSTSSADESTRPRPTTPTSPISPLDTPSLLTTWHPAIRSLTAFTGIAFAIRKLPWTSTLQASVTLAMVNPFLWYLVDRSRSGFALSAAIAILGTTFVLVLRSMGVADGLVGGCVGLVGRERIVFSTGNAAAASSACKGPRCGGAGTIVRGWAWRNGTGWGSEDSDGMLDLLSVSIWVASVLFCSCVCFGNIGRRLAWKKRP